MKILETVLAVVLAIVMLFSGIQKLVSGDFRADMDESYWGLPGWFFVLIGLAELLLVVDLLWPRFRILGGVGVFVVMIGAAVFNLFADEFQGTDANTIIPLNIVLALLGLLLAWLAAGRPKDLGALFEEARNQVAGQLNEVADPAKDVASKAKDAVD